MIEKIRVLVGDDHPMIVAGLRATLGQHPDLEVVGEIGTPAETLSLIEDLNPNVVVMDIDWWGDQKAGIEQIRRIRMAEEEVRIIAITAHRPLIESAKQAGADEARDKGFRADELAKSIRAVMKIGPPNPSPSWPPFEKLSERELEILKLMAKGLTDAEIGQVLGRAEPTVKAHVRSIYGKLAAKNRAEAVAKGYEYRLL